MPIIGNMDAINDMVIFEFTAGLNIAAALFIMISFLFGGALVWLSAAFDSVD